MTQHHWSPDKELSGFEALTLTYPDDYEGKVIATMIRKPSESPSQQAVLYIHGYMDYFFQPHLAEAFNQHGYNFYALDLRKYGRSLLPHQHPNFCKNIDEYFAEITDAIRLITEDEGNESLLLMGHSTGGLSSSLYADSGALRDRIDAVILNSPFFDWYITDEERNLLRVGNILGIVMPYFVSVKPDKPSPYMQSIHKSEYGEWDFSLDYRPIVGFPVYAGWGRAISKAHQRVHSGLSIQCPVLLLSSDKSLRDESYNEGYQSADTVLNVQHMKDNLHNLGNDVTHIQIQDGLHDLVLSRQDMRENFLSELFNWLETHHLSAQQASVSEG